MAIAAGGIKFHTCLLVCPAVCFMHMLQERTDLQGKDGGALEALRISLNMVGCAARRCSNPTQEEKHAMERSCLLGLNVVVIKDWEPTAPDK
jgi:hypothetical protein